MKTAIPESVGLDSRRLNRISRAMQAFVDKGRLPGAVAVVARRGEVVYAKCFGSVRINGTRPMQIDTILPIYSVTKPVTGVAVMMLYEEGHFQLYEPISKFIPEFKDPQVCAGVAGAGMEIVPAEREITIRHLLTHTAGIPSGLWVQPPLLDLLEEALQPDGTIEEIARALARVPLSRQPGEAWRYGDSYEILAYLVEVVSGMPFAAFLNQRIFEPLGMTETGYTVPTEHQDRIAKFHNVSEACEIVEAIEPDPYIAHPTLPRGSHGLYSTASDCLRFAQMLLNGGELAGERILGRKTVELMTENHLPDALMPIEVLPGFAFNGHGYGLGFRVLTDPIQYEVVGSQGEYGWYGLGGNYFWIDPREELIGIFMMRVDGDGYTRIDPQKGFYSIIDPFRVLTYQAVVD